MVRIASGYARLRKESLTMERIADSVMLLALVGVSLGPLRCLRDTLKPTALNMAWPWFCLAWIAWTAAFGLRLSGETTEGILHAAWYVAAVATLAPLVAVLGGRWPTSRVWSLFVVLPLLLVLLWPVAAAWLGMARWDRFELEPPMLLGGLLVSVMGWGNYVGSRWTVEALLGMLGTMLLLCSLTPEISPPSLQADRCGVGLACLLILTSAVVWKRSHQKPPAEPGDDQAWIDFQTVFGMVWSRRIQDRVNEQAREKCWPVRLGPRGWLDTTGQPIGLGSPRHSDGGEPSGETLDSAPPPESEARSFFLWLLQKFVAPKWIAGHG